MRTRKRPVSDSTLNDRLTVSMPRGMKPLVRVIAKDRDLDSSKLMRRGLDLYVKENEAKINKAILDEYRRFRNRYDD